MENTLVDISRRKFLKGACAVGLGAGLGASPLSCATLKETQPVRYPPLRGQKVQPPENGCYTGFFQDMPYPWGPQGIGKEPSITCWFYPAGLIGTAKFPKEFAESVAQKGGIPMLHAGIVRTLRDIVAGAEDEKLKREAEGAVDFGSKYGGFFWVPMWEMNLDRRGRPNFYGWQAQPEAFKDAWRRIWGIWEKAGANEFATWTIEYHVLFPMEGYYPGDQFVDWIALSAFNLARVKSVGFPTSRTLEELIWSPYRSLRHTNPEKPIAISEFGSTWGPGQSAWIRRAYQTIRETPGIKAAVYWNSTNWELGYNHELTNESIAEISQIFKDPYFVTRK